jgi:hypothetical protein
MFSQRGFSTAIATQNGNKAALFNGQAQIRKYGNTGGIIHTGICII